MASVLVQIDLDGDQPDPSSLSALAAGRAIASSWGATLYAGVIVRGATSRAELAASLARAGADKVILAEAGCELAPLWSVIGPAWQRVLEHVRPRLVLFGADSPSAPELGPRTGAKLGARVLLRARAHRLDEVELRDRDGGHVRSTDPGAAVALIGGRHVATPCDETIDVVTLTGPASADPRIELVSTTGASRTQSCGALVAIGREVAGDPAASRDASRLAALLGAELLESQKVAALAPDLCIAIGDARVDVAGTSCVVRIGGSDARGVEGALTGPLATSLAELCRTLEGS